ncbi:MAG: glycosyltransferase family 2 protein [Pseudomonadota bacterium]
MSNTNDVTVVFVTFSSCDVLPDAIASVPEGIPIISIDNASSDGSSTLARELGATVIDAGNNLGFGTACNLGARAAETPFVLFLNPDARLLPQTLDVLLKEAEASPQGAAFGPLILDGQGKPEIPRARTLLDTGPAMMDRIPEQTCSVEFLSGACLLVRREAFLQIGGFDEAIFLYLEDDDLCLRLRKSGHSLRLVPSAHVVHHQGTSAPPSRVSLQMRNHHTMASHVYLARKHGVSTDFAALRKQARKRLVQAWLKMDLNRIAVNRGRLSGLSAPSPGRRS